MEATKRKPTTRRRKPTGALARFADAGKVETRLLKPIQQNLLLAQGSDRKTGVIHASELSSNDFCMRAQYFWLTLGEEYVPPAFNLQNIFDYGHDVHTKWQNRAWNIGVLAGRFECLACDHVWYAVSPEKCEQCSRPRKALRYCEVDLALTSHMLYGHSDGWLIDKQGEALLEIKSIGEGTVRMEEYGLLKKHQYEDAEGKQRIDYKSLWSDIRRPFPAHIRQGNVYLHIVRAMGIDIDTMVFLYESKMTQGTKEFTVKYSEEVVAPLLDKCLDLKYAIKSSKPPKCNHGGCKKCAPFEENNGKATEHERDAGGGDARGAGTGRTGAQGDLPPRQARRRSTSAAGRPVRPGRPAADVTALPDTGLVRLLGRATKPR